MKAVFIFILTIVSNLICNCMTITLVDLSNLDNKEKTIDKKIALVGFNGFETILNEESYQFRFIPEYIKKKYPEIPLSFRANRFSYRIAIEKGHTRFSHFGKPIEHFSFTGYKSNITQTKINSFITNYVKNVGLAGLESIERVFHVEKNTEHFLVPDRDIDYYIVCANGPAIRTKTVIGKILFFPTQFLSVITLGTIPHLNQEESSSKFFIYNNNLDLIHEENLNESYWTISAWWIFPNKDDPRIEPLDIFRRYTSELVFISNISKFNKLLPQIILDSENTGNR